MPELKLTAPAMLALVTHPQFLRLAPGSVVDQVRIESVRNVHRLVLAHKVERRLGQPIGSPRAVYGEVTTLC